MIIIVSLIIVFQMLRMPSPKKNLPTYTLGLPVPTQANYYLDNVSNDQMVLVNADEFQEGKQRVTVVLDGTNYQVDVMVNKPSLESITKTTPFARVMTVGGSLDELFGLSKDYLDDAKFSVNSSELKPGKQTVTLTVFDQSVQQAVEVVDATKSPGAVALKYPVQHTDLMSLVASYLKNESIDNAAVSFVYHNLQTNEKVAFNESKTMLAAETVYLPISVLMFDEMKRGNVKEEFQTLVESMVLVSNAEAYTQVVELLGGRDKVYSSIHAYGQSSGTTQTVSATSQQTTADYLSQVIHYVYTHENDYSQLLNYMKNADVNTFISRYLGETPVAHKTGYVGQVINDVAVIYEHTPYALTLLSRDITATQFVEIAFLINEWHKYHQ